MINPEIRAHYDLGLEHDRLNRGGAPALERVRTQDILERNLPAAPARIIDVGGASGVYAAWLARAGYDVHLVDPVPLHVRQAEQVAAASETPFTAALGDARSLDEPDESADAVLLMGPLYHLVDRSDRVLALSEAARVVKPGGAVVAAAISRFASLLDGYVGGVLTDPTFAAMVEDGLETGIHRNPTGRPEWFTTAYFHRPEELAAEASDAGLVRQRLLGVEGPAWLASVSGQQDDISEPALLVARALEAEASAIGTSAHLLLVAERPRATSER